MPRKEYRLNPHTLTYEIIKAPLRVRIYRIVSKILIGFILASLFNFVFSYFFYTPKMYRIARDNREMVLKYGLLGEKIDAAMRRAEELKHRDQTVYRSLFGADTLDLPQAWAPYSALHYGQFADGRYTGLVTQQWQALDRLTGLVYLESESLDQLQQLSKDKDLMAVSIPAIWPIDRRVLRGKIGAFGWRNHPILHSYIMHEGIDLGSPMGTRVYATGNGRVVIDNSEMSGYGLQVLIDHGFGYKTRYAHLSRILVAPGQYVKRGEVIGLVGTTGRSTGPHLHYEVIYRGQHVDPINYIRKDMTEQQMRDIVSNAEATEFEK